ncbi:PAS domain-containing sensor histidine kinase, partial [bacterium]|nr:PAS domain-containing sensor histidine kinase [bacterium]
MRKRQLFWQLFPTYIAITMLALAAIFWYTSRSLDRFQRLETRADLNARAHLIESQFTALVTAGDPAAVDAACKALGEPSKTRITVILPDGQVIGDSDEDPAQMANHATADRPEMLSALAGKEGLSTRRSATLGQ